jgi:hypothetical protein
MFHAEAPFKARAAQDEKTTVSVMPSRTVAMGFMGCVIGSLAKMTVLSVQDKLHRDQA